MCLLHEGGHEKFGLFLGGMKMFAILRHFNPTSPVIIADSSLRLSMHLKWQANLIKIPI